MACPCLQPESHLVPRFGRLRTTVFNAGDGTGSTMMAELAGNVR